jgi:hypothetical protein
MSSKYKAFLYSKDQINLQEEEYNQQRAKSAYYLLSTLSKGSIWTRKESVRKLFFYLDLPFVKPELIKIYKSSSTPDAIKETIKSLHDGNLDVQDLIYEMEREAELDKIMEEARQEVLREMEQEAEAKAEYEEVNGKKVSSGVALKLASIQSISRNKVNTN